MDSWETSGTSAFLLVMPFIFVENAGFWMIFAGVGDTDLTKPFIYFSYVMWFECKNESRGPVSSGWQMMLVKVLDFELI